MIVHLQTIKRQVAKSTDAGYKSRSHKYANDGVLGWRVADKACDVGLQTCTPSRTDGDKAKAFIDVHNVGYKKFESSALAAYNKKIQESKDGIPPDHEVDDIAPFRLATNFAEGEDEFEAGEESALHEGTE